MSLTVSLLRPGDYLLITFEQSYDMAENDGFCFSSDLNIEIFSSPDEDWWCSTKCCWMIIINAVVLAERSVIASI
jgi:hypothetical protein